MRKLILYFVAFFALSVGAYSQSPQWAIRYVSVLENKDTVRTTAKNGNWWFGPIVGYNRNFYYNNLKTGFFDDIENPFNFDINYKGGDGGGWYTGFTAEYLPPKKYWGFGVDFYFPDVRYAKSKTDDLIGGDRYLIYYDTKYYYFSAMPYARFNFKQTGLHAFGGVSLDYNYHTDANQKIVEEVVNEIIHDEGVIHQDLKFRYGLSLGAGWDLMMTDVYSKVRVRFTPYISGNFGSKILGDNGSKWNEVMLKGGVKIKFGVNKTQYDTSAYIHREPVPVYLATVTPKRGIEFVVEERKPDIFPAMDIALVERVFGETELITPDVVDESVLGDMAADASETVDKAGKPSEPSKPSKVKKVEPEFIPVKGGGRVYLPTGQRENVQIKLNQPERYAFPSNKTTALTESMKSYLDELIKQMKANPSWVAIVEGHTNPRAGNTDEKRRISQERADKVKAYMSKRGITANRILSNGRSDLFPIADNKTAKGREANNRIEISVIKQ